MAKATFMRLHSCKAKYFERIWKGMTNLLWFRNGIFQLRVPSGTLQTMSCSFTLHLPLWWAEEENQKHKRSQVELRIIDWKHQWDTKLNSHNNINNRVYKRGEQLICECVNSTRFPLDGNGQYPTTPPHFLGRRNPIPTTPCTWCKVV